MIEKEEMIEKEKDSDKKDFHFIINELEKEED